MSSMMLRRIPPGVHNNFIAFSTPTCTQVCVKLPTLPMNIGSDEEKLAVRVLDRYSVNLSIDDLRKNGHLDTMVEKVWPERMDL